MAHNYGSDDTWYYDENYHYKKCTVCDSNNSIKSDTKKAHTYGTDGKCTTCGYDIKNVHDLERVDEVEPTCTKVGYKSYYRCKDEGCDVRYYSELGFLIRFTDMSEIELPKAEHVEGDCDENNGRETGWHLDASDSCWYYLDPNTGAMLTGWQLINGKWYFLAGVPGASTWSFDEAGDKWVYNNTDGSRPYGSLYIDTLTPDGFYVGSDGYWVE